MEFIFNSLIECVKLAKYIGPKNDIEINLLIRDGYLLLSPSMLTTIHITLAFSLDKIVYIIGIV